MYNKTMDKFIKIELDKEKETHFINVSHIVLIFRDRGSVFIKYDYEPDSNIEPFFIGDDEEALKIFIELKELFKKSIDKFIEKDNIILNATNLLNVFFSDDMYEETYWSIDFKGLFSLQRFSIDTVVSIVGDDIIKFKPEDFKGVLDE